MVSTLRTYLRFAQEFNNQQSSKTKIWEHSLTVFTSKKPGWKWMIELILYLNPYTSIYHLIFYIQFCIISQLSKT